MAAVGAQPVSTGLELRPLLDPRSVAVVGATERPDTYAGNVLTNLDRAGFEGPVWGVNPKRAGGEVHGRPCVASLAELPEPVDAVVVAIPAAGVPAVIGEAAERGCGGAVVLSAGFGEIAAGRALEAELGAAAVATGLPVCGPNGNGIFAVAARAPLWGDSVAPREPGPIALVSQSGNLAVNALGSRRGIGWHTIVSSGNQSVLDAADWLEALAGRDGVRSVALFCEADGEGARLCEALARCAERDIGVAMLKVGASAAGGRAAAAHTGALAGDQRVFRALVEEAGAAWAEDPHELLELARVLAEPGARPRRRGGVAVLTCSGGDSGVAADQAEWLGIPLPELGARTHDQLGELLPEAATIGNPLDYTALIWGESERLREIVATVGADPGVDQLLLVYDHPAGLAPDADASWAAVRAGLAAGAAQSDAAGIVTSTLPDLIDEDAVVELAAQGVPVVAGLRTALVCVRALRAEAGDPGRLREIAGAARGLVGLREANGAPETGNGWVAEVEAKALLKDAGVQVPDGVVVDGVDECVIAAERLGYPVVLKLSGDGITHKSEAGAIALDLADEESVRDAHARLEAVRTVAVDAARVGLLVERMVEPGVELIVAARADGVVPALVIGLGGVWAEALDDVVVVPLPASPARVERALRSLRGAPLLTGGRGRDAVDLSALASLAARTGEVLLERGLDLVELNPVVARPNGAIAVDALARRHQRLGEKGRI